MKKTSFVSKVTNNNNNQTKLPIEDLYCPISKDIMEDPVTTCDGYTFGKESITPWLNAENRSPATNLPLENKELIPNLFAAAHLKKYKEEGIILPSHDDCICPITLKIMKDPVLTCDGYTFEREAIVNWLKTHHNNPQTFQLLKHKELIPNYFARGRSDTYEQSAVFIESFHNAVRNKSIEQIESSLQYGVHINTRLPKNRTALHFSITTNDLALTSYLLEKKINVNVQDVQGQTALHYAVIRKQLKIIKILLKSKPNILLANTQQHTALDLFLIQALAKTTPSKRDIKTVELLLAYYSSLDPLAQQKIAVSAAVDSFGRTMLHHAVSAQNLKLVQLLIKHGFDVNALDNNGESPLYYAVLIGNKEIAGALCVASADVNTKNNVGESLLRLAIKTKNEHMVALLLGKGARKEIATAGSLPILHFAYKINHLPIIQLLIKHNTDINAVDRKGRTVLSYCAEAGDNEMISLLCDLGANTNIADQNGHTPLFFAKHIGIMQTLIMHGAALDQQYLRDYNWNKDTILHRMVDIYIEAGSPPKSTPSTLSQQEILTFIEFCLKRNASCDIPNAAGVTALHKAISSLDIKIITLLFERSANLKSIDRQTLYIAIKYDCDIFFQLITEKNVPFCVVDENGNTLLHQAAQDGAIKVAKFLTENHLAKIDQKNKDGWTPLHSAQISAGTLLLDKSIAMIDLLFSHGADPSALDNHGNTPLHLCAFYSGILTNKSPSLDIIDISIILQRLIAHGASINAANKHGSTPFHYSVAGLSLTAVRYFLSQPINPTAKDNEDNTALHHLSMFDEVFNLYAIPTMPNVLLKLIPEEQELLFNLKSLSPHNSNIVEDSWEDHFTIARLAFTTFQRFLNEEAIHNQIHDKRHRLILINYLTLFDSILALYNINPRYEDHIYNFTLSPKHFVKNKLRDKGVDLDLKDTENKTFSDYITSFCEIFIYGTLNDTCIASDISQLSENLFLHPNANLFPFILDQRETWIEYSRISIKSLIRYGYLSDDELASLKKINQKLAAIATRFIGAHIVLEIVQNILPLLLSHFDINAKNSKHQTPLLLAGMQGYYFIARLLEEQIKIPVISDANLTSLQDAVLQNNLTLIEFLLDKNIIYKIEDPFALHLAILSNNLAVIQLFLDRDVYINTCDEDGYSPLHRAVLVKNRKVVNLLLAHGALVNTQDHAGRITSSS